MEVVHDEEMLRQYVAAAVDVTPERLILIDRASFLDAARRCFSSDRKCSSVAMVQKRLDQDLPNC